MTPVLGGAIAVAVGTLAGHDRPALAAALAAAAVIALQFALFSRSVRVRAIALTVAFAAAAGANASWRSAASDDALLPRFVASGSLDACGTVHGLRPRSVQMRVDSIVRKQTRWTTSEDLRIAGRQIARLRPGQRVCATGEVLPPREGWDEAPLLVAGTITDRGTGSPVRLAAGAVRSRFSDAAQRVLPDAQAGLLLGMTEGDVTLLDEATMDDFRTTGLAHLVAVSGSNVAVVLALTMLLARALVRRRRWVRVLICVPPLVFFAFLTGLEPSVLRATVTAAIVLAVTAEGRTADGVRVAAFAFALLVFGSPELLFHPGFQLSFAATLGLIVWAQPLTERIRRRLPEGRAWFAIALCVGTTVAAQAAAAPFLAFHFGQIPALGGLANLVVAPLAPVVMIGGLATLTAASLVPGLQTAPVLMRLPLDLTLWCGRTFADLPWANVEASVAAGFTVSAALAFALATSTQVRRVCVAIALTCGAVTTGRTLAGGDRCPSAEVVALDVGQGTAVLLRAGGHAVLVDGGPESGGVVRDLDEQNVDSLDAVFVSHPHADHTQGLIDVIERLDVGTLVGPVTIGWGAGGDVVRVARRADVPVRHAAAGDTFRFGDELAIEVVSPEPVSETPAFEEDLVHAFGLVLKAYLPGGEVLLPGDIGAQEESKLLEADVQAPIFVAPHHGSKDVDPRFVELVDPRIVLVTVGADNRYGHPAPEPMRAYAARARVFRTDRDGAVTVCVGAGQMEVFEQR